MINTTTSKIQYTANGSTTVFAYPFLTLDQTHLVVVTTTAGVDSTKALTTDYTVDNVGNPAGGNVTFLVAPANGVIVTIYRNILFTQLVDYIENADFPSEITEAALDKLTGICQQLNELVQRCLRFPATEAVVTNPEFTASINRHNTLVGFDGSGNLYLFQLDPNTLQLIAASIIDTAHLQDGAVTTPKLAVNLDFTLKNITYKNLSIPASALATSLDLSTKSIIWPNLFIYPDYMALGFLGLDHINSSVRIEKRMRIGFGPGIDGFGGGTTDPVSLTVSGAGEPTVNGTYTLAGVYNAFSTWVKGTITIRKNPIFGNWEFFDSAGSLTWYLGADQSKIVTTPEQVIGWTSISGIAPPPEIELDATTERLEVNGNIKATQFIGDGSRLTGIQGSAIASLPSDDEGGSRTWPEGLGIISTKGELLSCGDQNTYLGCGGRGYSGVFKLLKRATFKAGVDPINGVTDFLNFGTDTIVSFKRSNYNSLALSASGILYAAGGNSRGQLGQGDTTTRYTYSSIRFGAGAGSNVKIVSYSIACTQSSDQTCCAAIDVNGQVWLWGCNATGQLGDTTTVDKTRPFKLGALGGSAYFATQVVCAGNATAGIILILTNDGKVWGAGANSVGQMATGAFSATQTTFAQCNAANLVNIQRIWARGQNATQSCYALASNGDLWSWGYNINGECGDTTFANRNTAFKTATSVTKFAVGGVATGYCIAIRSDNSVRTWGYNVAGQLGDTTTVNKSTPVTNPSSLNTILTTDNGCKKVVASGGDTACFIMVLTNAGNLYVAGYNGNGQVGIGNATNPQSSFVRSFHSRPTLADVGFIGDENTTGAGIIGLHTNGEAYLSGGSSLDRMSTGFDGSTTWVPIKVII